jgi:hypothetical protein
MQAGQEIVVVEYRSEINGYTYRVRVRAVPWKEVNYRVRERAWDEGVVPRGEAPPDGVIYQAGVSGEDDGPGESARTARCLAATPEEAAFKAIPWHLFERGWAIVEGRPHAVFPAAQGMHREAREREAAAYAARQAAAGAALREEARREAERRQRYEAMVGGCSRQVRLRRAGVGVFDDARGEVVAQRGYLVLPACGDAGTGLGVAGKTGKWQVIHLASGLGIGPRLRTLGEARALAARLLPLADWTQPAEVLVAGEDAAGIWRAVAGFFEP